MVRGRYARACDRANAVRLQRRWPGYLIRGEHGRWNAIHAGSLAVLGPVRSLRQLAAAIEADAWRRPVLTVSGLSIAIRAAGR